MMINYSQLDKKTIFSTDAVDYGTINNLSIADGLAVIHTNTSYITTTRICHIADIVTVSDVTITDKKIGIIGKQVYTKKGILIGQVTDCDITKGGKVRYIHCTNTVIPVGKIISISDCLLINSLPKATSTPLYPQTKRYGKCDFVLGKIVTKTIVNNSGETIAKQSSMITDEIIKKCKQHCKLLELMLYSR